MWGGTGFNEVNDIAERCVYDVASAVSLLN